MPGISIPCHVIFLPLWYSSFVLAILFPLLKVHNFCDKKTKTILPFLLLLQSLLCGITFIDASGLLNGFEKVLFHSEDPFFS